MQTWVQPMLFKAFLVTQDEFKTMHTAQWYGIPFYVNL